MATKKDAQKDIKDFTKKLKTPKTPQEKKKVNTFEQKKNFLKSNDDVQEENGKEEGGKLTLFTKVEDLPGIGQSYGAMLKRSGIQQVKDMIWLAPGKRIEVEISQELVPAKQVALNLTIFSVLTRNNSTFLTCNTSSGKSVKVVFFSKSKLFYKGSQICVLGELKKEGNSMSMSHPKWQPGTHSSFSWAEYPVKVPPAVLSKATSFILKNLSLPEWIDPEILRSKGWGSFVDALDQLHFKQKKSPRFKFDEALAHAYSLEMAFRPLMKGSYSLIGQEPSDFLERLGFPLTPDQLKSWEEIRADLISEERMLRILYGDVGSGKTFVAFLALLFCYNAGRQAALLAPTEILARQHFELLKSLMPEVNLVLLTRNERKKAVYTKIASEHCIIIGTHAILQEKVEFHSLSLLIIDEQHRFGVLQRMAINRKLFYNVLLMTATPIPRTLRLSTMGPIKTSQILSHPRKHRTIDIRILYDDRIEEVYRKLKSLLAEGDSIFWVCPLIEKSERKKGMDVATRSAALQEHFGDLVTSLHGRLDITTKQQILQEFFTGKKRILVSTTVIEVGINIPHANTMVIENSEIFGLAQLYQLMGRVGRGDAPGRCYFLYSNKSSLGRLSILQRCKSGFEIAQNDLRIRGFGNLLGSEQTGFFNFRFLNPEKDEDLMLLAQQYTKKKLLDDSLESKNMQISNLLELFSFIEDPWHAG